MNIQIQPDNTVLNHHVFRAADRMRIDGCANAVAHEGLSLALYCPYEALLDHYLNLLLARLRQQAPEHRIEVYFPANTDSLLGRFNEVLASQSLNQAVKASPSAQQAQIWLVHDAQTLPESEIQLLARLIQNFPGANIRAILLMSGNTHAEKSPLSAFGRKILRWDIEAPTPEQAQSTLEAARQDGQFNATQQLIQRIQRQQLPELNASFHAAMAPAPEAPAEPPPAPKSKLTHKVRAFHQRGSSANGQRFGAKPGLGAPKQQVDAGGGVRPAHVHADDAVDSARGLWPEVGQTARPCCPQEPSARSAWPRGHTAQRARGTAPCRQC
jgi:hypothetical protein